MTITFTDEQAMAVYGTLLWVLNQPEQDNDLAREGRAMVTGAKDAMEAELLSDVGSSGLRYLRDLAKETGVVK